MGGNNNLNFYSQESSLWLPRIVNNAFAPISSQALYGRDFLKSDIRPWFAIDDITYTPVPEPASATLGLISLAGLIAARRKRK